jgi:hypothetical protein
MSDDLRRAFFEDLAQVEDSAMASARQALSGSDVPDWVESEGACERTGAADRGSANDGVHGTHGASFLVTAAMLSWHPAR